MLELNYFCKDMRFVSWIRRKRKRKRRKKQNKKEHEGEEEKEDVEQEEEEEQKGENFLYCIIESIDGFIH